MYLRAMAKGYESKGDILAVNLDGGKNPSANRVEGTTCGKCAANDEFIADIHTQCRPLGSKKLSRAGNSWVRHSWRGRY